MGRGIWKGCWGCSKQCLKDEIKTTHLGNGIQAGLQLGGVKHVLLEHVALLVKVFQLVWRQQPCWRRTGERSTTPLGVLCGVQSAAAYLARRASSRLQCGWLARHRRHPCWQPRRALRGQPLRCAGPPPGAREGQRDGWQWQPPAADCGCRLRRAGPSAQQSGQIATASAVCAPYINKGFQVGSKTRRSLEPAPSSQWPSSPSESVSLRLETRVESPHSLPGRVPALPPAHEVRG